MIAFGHPLRPRHWGLALGLAMLLHAALALLVFQPATPGALAGGRGGIQVGLGPAGGAAGAPSDVAPAEAPGVEQPIPEAREALPPSAETLPPGAVAAAVSVEEVPVVGVPLQETTAQVAMPVPPKPRAKPKPPERNRQDAQAPEARQPAARESRDTTAAPAQGTPGTAVNGTRGKAGIGDTTAAGAARSAGAGGRPGDYVDYKQLIMSWLRQHKEYPRRAKLRRQEGEAFVFIVVDGNGRLLDYRLDKSSGHKLLDAEVTAMLERAQPLPAAQGEKQSARYEFRFRVDFWLQ